MAGLQRLQFGKVAMYRRAQQVTFRGGLGRASARKREALRNRKRVGPLGMAFREDMIDRGVDMYGVSPSEPIPASSGVTVSPALLQAPSNAPVVSPAISNYTDQIVNVRIGPPTPVQPVMNRPLPLTATIDAPASPTQPMQTSVDDSMARMYPMLRTDQTGPLASGMPAATTGNYVSAPGVGTPQQSTNRDGNPLPQAQPASAAPSSSAWEWVVLGIAALLVIKG